MTNFINRFRFPLAVGLTSIALVVALGVAGALVVPSALAGAPWAAGPWGAAHAFGGTGFTLPAELDGLQNLPPAERFQHFVGVQVSLKDKNGNPLTIDVTPGTITVASATSLTLAANDGTSKTIALDDRTVIRGNVTQGGSQPALASNEQVIVVTLNNSPTATAVIASGPNGFGSGGPRGPWGWHR